ncbi:MAG: TRAP transporter substrate-binding protein DctP [Synergistaceae bacterium]|nr:TRAP transporter substrate-binding protein DctP [Synergistaceae bacterium]
MKVNRLIIFVLVVCAMTASFASFASAAGRMAVSHHRAANSPFDNDIKALVAKIEKATNGRVAFDVFPASTLGSYETVQERVSIGDVASQFAPLAMQTDRKLGVSWFPYLAVNLKEAKALYGQNGLVRNMLIDLLRKQDLITIATWPAGIGGICVSKNLPNANDPFNAIRGLKIRVMANKVNEYVYNDVLHSVATGMAWGELFTALQTGVLDGLQGCASAESAYVMFRDVIKYYLCYPDHYESFYFVINKDIWDKIDKDDRDTVLKLCAEMEEQRWEQIAVDESNYRKKLAESGVQVITYKDDDMMKIRDIVSKECWPKVYNEVPKDMQDKIIAELKKISKE